MSDSDGPPPLVDGHVDTDESDEYSDDDEESDSDGPPELLSDDESEEKPAPSAASGLKKGTNRMQCPVAAQE